MNAESVSEEFKAAVSRALVEAQRSHDEAVRYMAQTIPVYAAVRPDGRQARAGGCVTCTYLGLWADRWPGYPTHPHGVIWLYEVGIRRQGGDLYRQVLDTLLHEMDHALQRDHVLEALGKQRVAAAALAYRPRSCCSR